MKSQGISFQTKSGHPAVNSEILERILFSRIVQIHICHSKKSRLCHDIPTSGPEVIKLFHATSAEHEIYPAHKC